MTAAPSPVDARTHAEVAAKSGDVQKAHSGGNGHVAQEAIAEVLSPAEVAALRVRRAREELRALSPELRLPPLDVPPLTDEGRAMARQLVRKGREVLRAYRAHRRALRGGKAAAPPKPGIDIDAAIERAYARDLDLARKTPERLWTDRMKRAVERWG